MEGKRLDIISFVISIFNILVTPIVVKYLPAYIPMHWNLLGEVDRMGSKKELYFFAAIPLLLCIIFYWLIATDKRVIGRIKSYWTICCGVIGFVLFVQYVTVLNAFGLHFSMANITVMSLGVLFIIFGNYMPQLKQNTVAGIRLPWTLKDEDTWRATHRWGGYCTIIFGIGFAILSLFTPRFYVISAMLTGIIVWLVVLTVYSYQYYKGKQNKNN